MKAHNETTLIFFLCVFCFKDSSSERKRMLLSSSRRGTVTQGIEIESACKSVASESLCDSTRPVPFAGELFLCQDFKYNLKVCAFTYGHRELLRTFQQILEFSLFWFSSGPQCHVFTTWRLSAECFLAQTKACSAMQAKKNKISWLLWFSGKPLFLRPFSCDMCCRDSPLRRS